MRTLLALFLLVSAWTMAATPAANPLDTDPGAGGMFPPSIEELTITVDGARMSGLLYQAAGLGPHPTVIMLHGFPGNEKNLDIAQVIRRAGFNVLFFHYRGAWGSEGDYCLDHLPDDVAAAVNFLRSNATRYRVNTRKISLLGHSMGGYAALAAGRKDPGLACVGAMSPANLGLMAEGIRVNESSSLQFLDYADGLFMLNNFDGKHMREDLLSISPMSLDTRQFGVGLSGKSVLMVVGDRDQVTPAESMFSPTVAAYERNSAIRLRHYIIPGDHSFSWSRIQLTELILEWLLADCR
jgi:pimeloyl-ACP methyl ester carboxylesterase